MHVFSGLMFGAFEYSWMLTEVFRRLDVLMFLLLSICPLVFLVGAKAKLSNAGVQLYALRRPYRHILADFGFYIATTGSFSILVSMYSRNLPVLDKDLVVPLHTMALMANLVLFGIAVYLFSLLAKVERSEIEREAIEGRTS